LQEREVTIGQLGGERQVPRAEIQHGGDLALEQEIEGVGALLQNAFDSVTRHRRHRPAGRRMFDQLEIDAQRSDGFGRRQAGQLLERVTIEIMNALRSLTEGQTQPVLYGPGQRALLKTDAQAFQRGRHQIILDQTPGPFPPGRRLFGAPADELAKFGERVRRRRHEKIPKHGDDDQVQDSGGPTASSRQGLWPFATLC
jgi:hypothetical protein